MRRMAPAPSTTAAQVAPPPLSDEARAVHAAATPIDLHADTPKLMARGYDFARRHDPAWPVRSFCGHVDLPRMREGNQRGQFFTMWTFPKPESGCAADVHRQIDAVEHTIRHNADAMMLCRSAEDVRTARAADKVAALLGIEGGHALERGQPADVLDRLRGYRTGGGHAYARWRH